MSKFKKFVEDIEIKKSHEGDFTKWCNSNGFKEVNCECIKKALASEDKHTREMANFAKNFAHKEC